MIPLDKLKSLQRAYVHANCPDGQASALVLKDALPDLEVHFVKYDTKEHKEIVPEPNTIFCDFSPWLPKVFGEDDPISEALRARLIQKWTEVEVIVLDHHDRAIVDPYTFGVFGENDKLECGAELAYRYVWVPLKSEPNEISERERVVQNFARLAAIRDTWKKDDPDFELACRQAAVLQFFRLDQLTFALVEDMQESLAPRLFERQIELAHSCIKEAYPITSDKGTRVLMFQGVSATSDAAELLDKEYLDLPPDLVVGFHYKSDGGSLKLQFSTRSHTGFDCRALAQAHGGNGHEKAAGFTIGEGKYIGNPYEVFGSLLNDYEEKL